MACEKSALARVWFRYPNGLWDNIVSRSPGVSARVEPVELNVGQCPVAYDITINTLINYEYQGRVFADAKTSSFRLNGGFGEILIKITLPGRGAAYLEIPYENATKILTHTTNNVANFGGRITAAAIERQVFRRVDGKPDDCIKRRCRFTVSDRTGDILQKFEDGECPTFYYQCEGDCPPGQCKCRRPGGKFCCCNCGAK
jgi:hypothetical protein